MSPRRRPQGGQQRPAQRRQPTAADGPQLFRDGARGVRLRLGHYALRLRDLDRGAVASPGHIEAAGHALAMRLAV